ncbi:hypothetical protein [Lusitaniella coriacea]|uniref:hypothetical protein n=1 Tax=Lusitaniella coriacea TaxID=1983105 RepID=UPI003CF21AA3
MSLRIDQILPECAPIEQGWETVATAQRAFALNQGCGEDRVLVAQSLLHLNRGQFDRAIQVAGTIRDDDLKAKALAAIAGALIGAGQSDKIPEIARKLAI